MGSLYNPARAAAASATPATNPTAATPVTSPTAATPVTSPTAAAATGRLTFQQQVPSATWKVTHNLNCYPEVVTIDSAGSEMDGDISYNDLNNVTVRFGFAIAGILSIL